MQSLNDSTAPKRTPNKRPTPNNISISQSFKQIDMLPLLLESDHNLRIQNHLVFQKQGRKHHT